MLQECNTADQEQRRSEESSFEDRSCSGYFASNSDCDSDDLDPDSKTDSTNGQNPRAKEDTGMSSTENGSPVKVKKCAKEGSKRKWDKKLLCLLWEGTK